MTLEEIANTILPEPIITEKVVVEPGKYLDVFSAYFEPIPGGYYACTPIVAENLGLLVISEWPLKMK